MAKAPRNTPAKTEEQEIKTTVSDVDYIRDLDGLLAVRSPKNREDADVRFRVERLLKERHAAIETFVAEQIDKGLTLDEILAFSAVETPLFPTVKTTSGRTSVEWPFRIIGPDD
ncbi:hypothetical protein [Sinorhizobium meliloti]|uniref:hypothetical protein n=1 Tax=Rhizobium meliloti TaxID=382 RepID=UPI000FD8F69D|nr:hypothetical protein [Sinorhizobium meliloti]RVO68372.1 hypothetical protein CN087_12925 [Sinorhizobium meliloti]